MSLVVFDFELIIAIAILIGLPIVLTLFSEKDFSLTILLVYMTIINSFIVSIGILPLWTQVLFLVILIGIGYIEVGKNKNGGI